MVSTRMTFRNAPEIDASQIIKIPVPASFENKLQVGNISLYGAHVQIFIDPPANAEMIPRIPVYATQIMCKTIESHFEKIGGFPQKIHYGTESINMGCFEFQKKKRKFFKIHTVSHLAQKIGGP